MRPRDSVNEDATLARHQGMSKTKKKDSEKNYCSWRNIRRGPCGFCDDAEKCIAIKEKEQHGSMERKIPVPAYHRALV